MTVKAANRRTVGPSGKWTDIVGVAFVVIGMTVGAPARADDGKDETREEPAANLEARHLDDMASSANPGGDGASPGRRVAAVRARRSVVVDGILDEADWGAAPATSGFWQRSPKEGAQPTYQTEFRVLYDNAAIYVGVTAFDDDPRNIRAMLTRRDEESPSDWIYIGLDSYHDRRTGFFFGVNPKGVRRDFLMFNDSEVDLSWDAVWSAAARVHDRGWTVELEIPLGQLRFTSAEELTWGMQVQRVVGRSNEESVWSPWPRTGDQAVSRFGAVYDLTGIEPPRRLELLPYAVGGLSMARVDDGDPFRGDADATGSLGLDFKYGLGQSATIVGTINPDFGQVEADPSMVNLDASELFFTEKRPFFLEGTEIFQFALGDENEQLFYTRRIGATPHGSANGLAAYTSQPRSTTIYGAAKLSGKTTNGWSYGVLDAVTAEETARLADADGNRSSRVIEPLTNYSVLRLAKDIRGGRTHVNGAFTAVHRRLEDTGLEWLHDQAYAGGVAFDHRFGGDRWLLQTRLVGSHVHGTAEAIDQTQRSFLRYYQRPDADHLDYDPARTSLTGGGLTWSLSKLAGGHWRFGTGGEVRTPGLEFNDLGFQSSADSLYQWMWGQYRDDAPGRYLLSYGLKSEAWAFSDTALAPAEIGGNISGFATFANYWNLSAGGGPRYAFLDPKALRGGPALRGDPRMAFWLVAASDSRRMVRGQVDVTGVFTPASDSRVLSVNSLVTVQAMSNLDIGVGAAVVRNLDDQQYVQEVQDTAGTPRYILGRLNQTTLALTLRVNYTFRPDLSLQLYAQPFTSTGGYTEFKDVRAPRARAYDDRFDILEMPALTLANEVYSVDRDGDGVADYAFDRPDFNFRQLRSNLVLRWEYLPGSALFLVWSHERSSADATGVFDVGDEARALVDEPGEHLVMIKASYWYAL